MAQIVRFFSRLLHSYRVARTHQELRDLSDHRLRDLGLRREQIDRLFR